MGEKNNKLVKGIMLGAIAGAAVSLLDRQTREDTAMQVKTIRKKVWEYSKNPSECMGKIRNKITETRHKLEEVTEDIAFIVEKVNDIKETGDRLRAAALLEDGREGNHE